MTRVLLLFVAAPALLWPILVSAAPPKSTLVALTALELLDEQAGDNPDLTLQPLVQQAAGALRFPRMSAADTLAAMADRILAGEDSALVAGRTLVETAAAQFISDGADTINAFGDELLALTAEALRSDEDVFVEEVIGEAADAAGLSEVAGSGLAMHLIGAAIKELRPAAPDSLKRLPNGLFVLGVHVASTSKQTTSRYEYYQWLYDDAEAKRRAEMWTTLGSYVVADVLRKSMSLRRKFRRIIPCADREEARFMNVDYLLVLDADWTWERVEDSRGRRQDAGEVLSLDRQRAAARVHPGGYDEDDGKVAEMTMTIEASITTMGSQNEAWALQDTVKRFRDELVDETKETGYIEVRGGLKIERNSLMYGALSLLASRTRIQLAKVR